MSAADLLHEAERQLRESRRLIARAAGVLVSGENPSAANLARLGTLSRLAVDVAAIAERVYGVRLGVDGELQAEAARMGYQPRAGHLLDERERAGRDGPA